MLDLRLLDHDCYSFGTTTNLLIRHWRRLGFVLTFQSPSVNLFEVETRDTTDFESRQLPGLEHSINCALM
jgi:hypothetical protein